MKFILVITFLSCLILCSCGSDGTCVNYDATENQETLFQFKFNESDSSEQTIKLISYTNKEETNEPLFIQFKYAGEKKYAEKIISIDVKVFGKGESSTEFTKEITPQKSFVSSKFKDEYYFDDPGRELDFTGNLNTLILRDDFNSESTINYFFIDKEYDLKELSGEIKIEISVKWIDGEIGFTTILKRNSKPCNGTGRTNPFG